MSLSSFTYKSLLSRIKVQAQLYLSMDMYKKVFFLYISPSSYIRSRFFYTYEGEKHEF